MTPALKAMVEAMAAELRRQTEDEDGVRGGVIYETGPGEHTIDARGVSLEKVARAGLEAIREPTWDQARAAIDAYKHDMPADEQFDGSGIGMKQAWRGMIDAILKEDR